VGRKGVLVAGEGFEKQHSPFSEVKQKLRSKEEKRKKERATWRS